MQIQGTLPAQYKCYFSSQFNYFLAGIVRNFVYCACCSAQMANKPVQQRREQVLRAYCPNIYLHAAVALLFPQVSRKEDLSFVLSHTNNARFIHFSPIFYFFFWKRTFKIEYVVRRNSKQKKEHRGRGPKKKHIRMPPDFNQVIFTDFNSN